MNRPPKTTTDYIGTVLKNIDYAEQIEEYCNLLEASFKKQKARTDYWCTKAMEYKALYREQVKETARVRRDRPL